MQVGGVGDESPFARLGRLIRQARGDAGWTQDELAAASGISRPTIQRIENAKGVPELETVRAIVVAIPGLDAREIPVALGLVTREEMGLPPERVRLHRYDPVTEDILTMLQDRRYSADEAKALAGLLRAQLAARPQVEEPAQDPQDPPTGVQAV